MPKTLEPWPVREGLPAREQVVVDEFNEMIRKHQDQDPTTLARLLNVAFEHSVSGRTSRQDKLARAALRGLETRRQLAAAEGGSLSSEETARMLRISKTAVLKRLQAGKLLAWREERLQAARYPCWQFDQNGRVLTGLEEALAILNENKHLDAWGKILFFLQKKTSLEGRRPLDLLREGGAEQVCLAASAYAE
jgi:hypothetical protein